MANTNTDQVFKLGDVVILKSGGPQMTVSSPECSGRYLCVWFSQFETGYQLGTAEFFIKEALSLSVDPK
jgi:uncharacterized protein YodC (DUF2158 family)